MTGGSLLRALRFAWISTRRQPARAALGILGVAAVGALLFDMLLLSRGLVRSFGDLLDRGGFDLRVLASDAPPFAGVRIPDATAEAARIAALPEVDAVLPLTVEDVEIDEASPSAIQPAAIARPAQFIAADPSPRPMWTILEGEDLPSGGGRPAIVVNRVLARERALAAGSTLTLRGRCGGGADVVPAIAFHVSGIAEFPFDAAGARTIGGARVDLAALCGTAGDDRADLMLVRATPGVDASRTAAAIRRALPDLHVVTNADLVERFSRVEFSYFRQISFVLATVTLFFGFLLIAVLLTVSVNQQLGELAVLRAVGLSRPRIVAGVLCESALLVGAGGLLAVPLGLVMAAWLERILKAMPGVPDGLRFFVFEPRALVLHAALLAVAAAAAAAYPMRIVATLPIAETLRREVVS